MLIACLLVWTATMLALARWICGRWFNHLSLYTVIWSTSIFAYDLRLIEYHHVVFEAWIYVFVAWVAIYLGTMAAKLGLTALPREQRGAAPFPNLNMNYLRWAILLFGAAGLASSVVLAFNTLRTLGAQDLLTALTSYGAQIYELRFNGEVSGLMYVVFLPYAGCVLSGIYCARLGRITLVALLPVFAMLADGFISMQRLGIFVGVLLFSFSYSLTPKSTKLYIPQWQKAAIACTILLGFFLVTISRAATQVMESGSATLADAGDSVPGLSSLYFYASAPIPTFSEYLKHPEEEGKALWGRYMFASIYRFGSKLGFDTYVPYYAPFYYTPIPDNAATYLREIHWDFGGSAIFIFPFGLGFLIAYLEIQKPTAWSVVLGSFLYVVVFFSCHFNFMGGGGWYFPLPIALLVAYIVSTPQLFFATAPRLSRRT